MADSRLKCRNLPDKLLRIREALGLSQSEILSRLGFDDVLVYNRISDYERGERQPPLPLVLRYAQLVGISTDVLLDDKKDLPAKLRG